jgi:hypothetical protein
MSYTVASDNFEAKKKGDSVTEKELLELGLNVEALIAGGYLKSNAAIKTTTVEETK